MYDGVHKYIRLYALVECMVLENRRPTFAVSIVTGEAE